MPIRPRRCARLTGVSPVCGDRHVPHRPRNQPAFSECHCNRSPHQASQPTPRVPPSAWVLAARDLLDQAPCSRYVLFSCALGIHLTQPFALSPAGGAVPLDRAGRPRPAAAPANCTTIAGSPCSFGCPPRQASLPFSRNYHRAGSRLMFGAPLARLAGTKARKRAGTPGGTVIPSGSRLLPVWQALPASPAHRSPILLLRLPGSSLLRFDTRAFLGSLFQEPPRSASALFPSFESRKKNHRRLRRRFNEASPEVLRIEKEKEKKSKGNLFPRAPQPDKEATDARLVPVTVRHARVTRIIVPGAAPQRSILPGCGTRRIDG